MNTSSVVHTVHKVWSVIPLKEAHLSRTKSLMECERVRRCPTQRMGTGKAGYHGNLIHRAMDVAASCIDRNNSQLSGKDYFFSVYNVKAGLYLP